MGLIKAAASAVGSTLHDQWKDYIRCEDLGNDILMKRVSTPNGIVSKDSAVQVAPGQIAVIFDSGKILDATAEEGIYTFDSSTSPSFFAGQFGPVFKEMWNRFTYGGGVSKEQAVFFINAKEIIDNNNVKVTQANREVAATTAASMQLSPRTGACFLFVTRSLQTGSARRFPFTFQPITV